MISIEKTNNNTIIKFVFDTIINTGVSQEFNNIDEAKASPLAQQLFYLPFVKKMYVSNNFIAIQRFDIVDWKDVQNEVKEQIENYVNDGNPIIIETNTGKKDAIEVYAEVTPNPAVMKFGTNKKLTEVDFEFKNMDEASTVSPLAVSLFQFSFVKEVFVSENYISITKYDMVEWNTIYPEIRTFIRTYLQDKKEIISSLPTATKKETTTTTVDTSSLDDISKEIIAILDEHIKPAVASDGGNIAFKKYDAENKIVSVILQGACSGCPSSTITLKNGIETLLKEMLPNKINEVVAFNG